MKNDTLRKFIKESIVDAKDRFKKKQSDDLKKKLKAISDEMPSILQSQNDQEKQVNDMLSQIDANIENKLITKSDKLKLAPVLKNKYAGEVIDTIRHVSKELDPPEEYEILRSWALENVDKLHAIITMQSQILNDVENFANTLKWLIPWRKYTNWFDTHIQTKMLKDNIKQLIQ